MGNLERIQNLPCWQGTVDVEPLSGGMTNHNFTVSDGDRRYVVRLGEDIPEHLVWRQNEGAISLAAADSGFSPKVRYREPGVLVIDFIDGRVFNADDVRNPQNLSRLVDLLCRFHAGMPERLNSYPMLFWVFQVIRHYAGLLKETDKPWVTRIPRLLKISASLEHAVGEIKLVLAHNDLLPANFIDDGTRLWLIDFDYAGFNSPLFDLANLASNSEMEEAAERTVLEQYFGQPPSDELWHRYSAMKCASLMREMMWSMVSEVHSKIDFDYTVYTSENTDRFERAYAAYREEFGQAD